MLYCELLETEHRTTVASTCCISGMHQVLLYTVCWFQTRKTAVTVIWRALRLRWVISAKLPPPKQNSQNRVWPPFQFLSP